MTPDTVLYHIIEGKSFHLEISLRKRSAMVFKLCMILGYLKGFVMNTKFPGGTKLFSSPKALKGEKMPFLGECTNCFKRERC